jgi:hypothetical protein
MAVSTLLCLSIALPAAAAETSGSTASNGSSSSAQLGRRALKSNVKKTMHNQMREHKAVKRAAKMEKNDSLKSGTCVSGLVATREDAIMAAHDAFDVSWKQARTTLKTALVAAWNANDSGARMAAWKAFRTSVKTAMQTRRTAVKAAWEAFRTGVKNTCKEEVAADAENVESDTDSAE